MLDREKEETVAGGKGKRNKEAYERKRRKTGENRKMIWEIVESKANIKMEKT